MVSTKFPKDNTFHYILSSLSIVSNIEHTKYSKTFRNDILIILYILLVYYLNTCFFK